jgi:hypothetical protein
VPKDLQKARQQRAATIAGAVAETVATPAPASDEKTKVTSYLPKSLLIRVDEVALDAKRAGVAVSQSGMIETALRELLDRPDAVDVIRRYGVSYRRT